MLNFSIDFLRSYDQLCQQSVSVCVCSWCRLSQTSSLTVLLSLLVCSQGCGCGGSFLDDDVLSAAHLSPLAEAVNLDFAHDKLVVAIQKSCGGRWHWVGCGGRVALDSCFNLSELLDEIIEAGGDTGFGAGLAQVCWCLLEEHGVGLAEDGDRGDESCLEESELHL